MTANNIYDDWNTHDQGMNRILKLLILYISANLRFNKYINAQREVEKTTLLQSTTNLNEIAMFM